MKPEFRSSKLKKRLKLPKINPNLKKAVKRVFGFEECKKDKYLKSELDEMEVAITLTRMQTDLNWVKRILWLLVAGTGVGFYYS